MTFELKNPWEYGASKEGIFNAAVGAGFPKTKVGLFDATLYLSALLMVDPLVPVLKELLDTYVLFNGERPSGGLTERLAWDTDAISEGFEDVVGEAYMAPLVTYFPSLDNFIEWLKVTTVDGWRAEYGDNPGQFLAKFKIVAADYEEKAAETLVEAIPPPVVSVGGLVDAWVAFGNACTIDQGALSDALGVSRSTVSNYANGKAAKPKCNAAQATTMVVECEKRIEALKGVIEVFKGVK